MWKRLLNLIKGTPKKKRPARSKSGRRKKARPRAVKRAPAKRRPKRRPLRRTKRPARKATAPKKAPRPAAEITHYFPKVRAAVLKLNRPLRIGDPVWIKGHTTDFRQTVGSLQIDRVPITTARPGQDVGLEVMREVRAGDKVFLVEGRTR